MIIGGIAAAVCVVAACVLSVAMNQYSLTASAPAEETIVLEYGEAYQEEAVSAIYRGTIFNKEGTPVEPTKRGEVDMTKLGTYEVYYDFEYEDLTTTAKRTIIVRDTTPPKITLLEKEGYVTRPNMPYEEEGFTAVDVHDGDLTAQVERTVTAETIVYTVTDAAGNRATVERPIVYIDWEVPDDKVVYLTFDDGPGEYTERLLDILDEHDVKVTFFVTNQHPNYQDMIGEAARRGHTIAVHTYSHKFSEIYASEENYFADFEAMVAICEAQTGRRPTLLRFPGGTANGTSRKYCEGIMTALVEAVTERGYLYCDWNVDAEDSVGTKTAEGVAQNVINGIRDNYRPVSIVLQHDVKEYSVEAVDEIIRWGKENGYTFLPLMETSQLSQQKPNN